MKLKDLYESYGVICGEARKEFLVFSYQFAFMKRIEIVLLQDTPEARSAAEEKAREYCYADIYQPLSEVDAHKHLVDRFFKPWKNKKFDSFPEEKAIAARLAASISEKKVVVQEYENSHLSQELAYQLTEEGKYPLMVDFSKHQYASILRHAIEEEIMPYRQSYFIVHKEIFEGNVPLILDGIDEHIPNQVRMFASIAEYLADDSKAWVMIRLRDSSVLKRESIQLPRSSSFFFEC